MTPRVSVLMAVYNGATYLPAALDSVLRQSFTDFELIVIDDGSSDGAELILDRYAQRDERLVVVHRQNQGLVPSLNQALTLARGTYLARMDGDDLSLARRFERQVQMLESQPELVAVGTMTRLIDPQGWPIKPYCRIESHEDIDRQHLMGRGGMICHPSVMMRADTVRRVGGYRAEAMHAEDLDLFLRLAEVGRLANHREVLFEYRMQPSSIGHTKRAEQHASARWAIKDACQRRGIAVPEQVPPPQAVSLVELHRKWAWWALSADNHRTALKHAGIALGKRPQDAKNWHALAIMLRGAARSTFSNGRVPVVDDARFSPDTVQQPTPTPET